jgi:hypothetical protein
LSGTPLSRDDALARPESCRSACDGPNDSVQRDVLKAAEGVEDEKHHGSPNSRPERPLPPRIWRRSTEKTIATA